MKKLRIGLIACLVCVALACCLALTACNDKEDKTEKFAITWQPDENVTIVAEGYDTLPTELAKGTEVVFTATPANGYEIATVTPASVKKDGEKYKFTVERDLTVKVTSRRVVASISVEKPDTLVYYAGNEIDREDYKVTVNYVSGDPELTTSYAVSYQNGNAFALGDTKFTISYSGKTVEVELDSAVVGLVTLNLSGGTLSDEAIDSLKTLPGYNYDTTEAVVSWTFSEAFAEDFALPVPEKEVNNVPFDFIRWSGVENDKIAKDTATSLTVTALYEVRLVEINSLEFTKKDVTEGEGTVTVPYLVISGKFLGATEAYLFLFEGNKPVTSLEGPTVTRQSGTDEFTCEFDLRDFVNAEVDTLGEDGKPTGNKTNLKGKWMDIKFCATLEGEGRTETQEINLNNYADDFINTAETLEAQVDGTWWQFAYKVHTPNKGDMIHGSNGAVYEGNEKLLKLVYQDCPPVSVSNVTLRVADRDVTGETGTTKVPTAYIVVTGDVIQAKDKAEAEALMKDFEFTIQANSSWEYPTVTKVCTINNDLTYELTLSLENLVEGKGYYMHFGGNNFAAAAEECTAVAGTNGYTLNNHSSGDWTNGLVWLTMTDTSVPTISVTGAKLESGTVNLGTTEEPQNTEVAMLVLSGTWSAFEGVTLTEEQAVAGFKAHIYHSVQTAYHFGNTSWDHLDGGSDTKSAEHAIVEFNSDGTFTVKLLLSGAVAGRAYYVHVVSGSLGTSGITVDDTPVTVGEITYGFVDTSSMDKLAEAGMTSESQTWYLNLLMVSAKTAETPAE